MRRYKVEPQEVNKLFPDEEPMVQKQLLAQRLQLDVGYRDGYFIIWSRSLVRFAFHAELIPFTDHDPDIEKFQKGNCHLLVGEHSELQRSRVEDRPQAGRDEATGVSRVGRVNTQGVGRGKA